MDGLSVSGAADLVPLSDRDDLIAYGPLLSDSPAAPRPSDPATAGSEADVSFS